MGNPAYGQRTPLVGLKVESDDTRNFNWLKLDDTFARLGQPGSLVSLPGSLLVPQRGQNNVAPVTLTTTPQEVTRVTLATSTGGPHLCLGTAGCTIQSSAGSTAAALIQVTLTRTAGAASPDSHTLNVQFNVAAGQTIPIMQMPLNWCFAALGPAPALPVDVAVTMAELGGVAGIVANVQFGYLQVTEFEGTIFLGTPP